MDTQNSKIRLMLVDDEDIIRYGLGAILRCQEDIEIVGEAANGKEAVEQAKRLQPDIVLMDISMPVMDGVAATGEICKTVPDVKVLILTTSTEDSHLRDAVCQGASGYLLKNIPPEDFIALIKNTCKGYIQFDPTMGQKLHDQLKPPTAHKAVRDWQGITPREKEVLHLIAKGANNREISKKLHISEKTVKNHVSNILSRVGLRDRTQLAIWVNTTSLDRLLSS